MGMKLPKKQDQGISRVKRLPEAVPVANADQSDTPGLGRLVQSRLHLLTHSTAELQSWHIAHLVASSIRAREGF